MSLYSFLGTNLHPAQMGDSGSSTQTSNKVTVVASNITKAKKHILVETQGTSEDTVGQGSQQPATVSEKTSANESENMKEATSEENGNELNVSDAGHTVSDTADVTSSTPIVAKKDEEIKHVVLQQTVVTETWAEIVKNPSTSQERNVVNDQSKRNESDVTGSTDVDNTVQAQNDGLMPSGESCLPEHAQNVSGSSGSKSTKRSDPCINQGKDEIDVLAQFDEILEDLGKTDRRENVSFEERMQKLVQQLEEKEKECHKTDLKTEYKETNKNSHIPDTGGEETDVDEIVREKLDAKTSGNEQQTAKKNSEDGSATKLHVQTNLNNTQETVLQNREPAKVCLYNLNGQSVLIYG